MREHVLRQIFGFRWVAEHAEAERIDAPEVAAIKLLEGVRVACGRSARQFHVARWLCLNFGRAHASPLAQSARRDCPSESLTVFACLTLYHSRTQQAKSCNWRA